MGCGLRPAGTSSSTSRPTPTDAAARVRDSPARAGSLGPNRGELYPAACALMQLGHAAEEFVQGHAIAIAIVASLPYLRRHAQLNLWISAARACACCIVAQIKAVPLFPARLQGTRAIRVAVSSKFVGGACRVDTAVSGRRRAASRFEDCRARMSRPACRRSGKRRGRALRRCQPS